MDINKNIYKIAYYYSRNPHKYAIFVETSLSVDSFIDLLGAITFAFEEAVTEEDCMDERHLLHILTTFFDVVDVTAECQPFRVYTKIPVEEWALTNCLHIPTDPSFTITQIDWYEAREVGNRTNFREIMEAWLPASEAFREAIRCSDYYPSYFSE